MKEKTDKRKRNCCKVWVFIAALTGATPVSMYAREFATVEQQQKRVVTGSVTDEKGQTVSGVIKDDMGEPLIGVSVAVKGSRNGTITDDNGYYKLTDIPVGSSIVVSYIGMVTQEFKVTSKPQVNLTMKTADIKMNDVIVTALGISREKKALGYSVQEVSGDVLSRTKELNVVKALAGKVSGVNIIQGEGNVGPAGARIVIRGEKSLSGSNAPLYVIDGVVNNDINNISSYDIESLSVLKGPAASALYGSKAGPGVIVVTTKKGTNKQLRVELNSNVTLATHGIKPDMQTIYGQGQGGVYSDKTLWSWGPKFEGQDILQSTGSTKFEAHNNGTDFYDTGVTFSNNIVLSSADEISHFRLSYTNYDQKGMVPGTKYDENRIDLNTGRNFYDKKLQINLNVKYRGINGGNNSGIDLRKMPLNVDLDLMKDYWLEKDKKQRRWAIDENNMYFNIHENTSSSRSNKFVALGSIDYDFTSHLNLMLRSSVNASFDKTENRTGFTNLGLDAEYGSYGTSMSQGYESTNEWLLTYKNNIKDFSLVASAGGSMYHTNWDNLRGNTSQLFLPGSWNLANHRVYPTVGNTYDVKKQINSLYALINLGYKNYVYLDLTARNDWTSTLAYKKNDAIFYPSASLSVLLNNIINLGNKIDLLKVKANYAEVGNSTEPYQLQPFISWDGSGPLIGLKEEGIKPYADLKPERVKSYELGTQLTMFNNRFNLDVTYYHSITSNQIWRMKVSPVSGYDYMIRNIGEITNNGLEITMSGTPIKTKDFAWTTSLNWSTDRSEVSKLDPENPEYAISNYIAGGIYTYDRVGQKRGSLYSKTARRFHYDPAVHDASMKQHDGKLYFNGSKDLPWTDDFSIIGNSNPDFTGSWINDISWKGLTLSAMFYFSYGSSFFNSFEKDMVKYGLDPRTVAGRDDGKFLPDAVWDSPTGPKAFAPGDEVNPEFYWSDCLTDGRTNDIWVTDGSYIKLKELSLTYDLPLKWISKIKLNKTSIGVTGRNLYSWSKVKHVDPEVFTGGENGVQVAGVATERYLAPPRTFTFNLNITF